MFKEEAMGFIFDGVSSSEMGIPSRMSVQNRIPDIRNNTDKLAGRHGIMDFGETISERKIEITCLIPPGLNAHQLLDKKDSIVGWLNPDKGLCRLELGQEPDRYYNARLFDGVSFINLVRNADTFDLSFFCPDPFAYAIQDEKFILKASGDIKRTLGNVESHPVYEIRGNMADSSQEVKFLVNGESVTLCGPLSESDVLVIDTDDMTVKIGTENALGQMKELNFPYLKAGTNTITFSESTGTLTSVCVKAKSRWL